MSTSQTLRERFGVGLVFDWPGAVLAALFLAVQGVAVTLALLMQQTPETAAATNSVSSASSGAAYGGAVVVEGIALFAIVLLWDRLPNHFQTTFKHLAIGGAVLYVGAMFQSAGIFRLGAAVALGGYALMRFLKHADLYHFVVSIETLLVAALVGGVGGAVLGMVPVVLFVTILTIYDHFAANKSHMMFRIGKPLVAAGLPVLVIIPQRLRIDWDDITAMFGDEDDAEDDLADRVEEQVAMGIGNGDFMVPALLAAAAATSPLAPAALGGLPAPVLGVITGSGLVAFRLRHQVQSEGSGAGLPAISTFAFGGLLVGGVVALIQLGVAGVGL